MKAARYYGVRDVRVEEVNIPVAKDGEVLVRVAWCGICGSDLKNYTVGSFGTPTTDRPDAHTGEYLPVTLGHEACGEVAATTAGCPYQVGQCVMVDPRLYCGKCHYCKAEKTHLCEKSGFLGLSGGGGGGFSEMMAVRWQQCHPIPRELLSKAALIEPLAVARHGLRSAKFDTYQDRTALVLGGGPIGQAVIYDLKAAGAKQIIVYEPAVVRRKQVAKIPCTVIEPTKTDLGTEVRKLTGGLGVDVVFDCAGIPAATKGGMESLRKHGVFVQITSCEKPIEVSLVTWMSNEITLEASLAYTDQDFRDVVEDFVNGKFAGAEKMIISRIALSDLVTEGLDKLTKAKDECTKIMVSPV